MTVVVAGCGGGDEADRQDYVDALIAAAAENNLSDEENICFAEAIVDAAGVDKLRDAVTPEEIRDREPKTTNVVDLGVEVDEEQGQDFYEQVRACVDLRALLIKGQLGDAPVSEDATACLDRELTDDLLRRLMVTGFTMSDAGLERQTDLVAEVQAAFAACTPA